MSLWDFKYRRKSIGELADFICTDSPCWLNVRQKRFLIYLAKKGNPWLANNDYRKLNHLSERYTLASRDLEYLVRQKLLKTNGYKRRARKYSLHPHFCLLYKGEKAHSFKPKMPQLQKIRSLVQGDEDKRKFHKIEHDSQ